MKKSQVKGYLLEIVLARLLKINGYQIVSNNDADVKLCPNGLNVRGRGGYHQFDSLGTFRVTPPFVYPIRLFLEAKFHSKKIGIDRVRMGVGILQDVNTNYSTVEMSNDELEVPKYHYNYAIFSTSDFTEDAQRMAIAHKIYLIDLSSGYYSWIKDFINQIVDRLFGYFATGDSISSDIFNDFKKDFSSWVENIDNCSLYSWNFFCSWLDAHDSESIVGGFRKRLESTGNIYIASTKSSQIIALLPDNDEEFQKSLRRNPHQEVTITFNELQNDVWVIIPTNNDIDYRLTFQLPSIIQEYIFNNSENLQADYYNAKSRIFGQLAFIAYLDGENPTLCTLKFNEAATKQSLERYNHPRLENRFND